MLWYSRHLFNRIQSAVYFCSFPTSKFQRKTPHNMIIWEGIIIYALLFLNLATALCGAPWKLTSAMLEKWSVFYEFTGTTWSGASIKIPFANVLNRPQLIINCYATSLKYEVPLQIAHHDETCQNVLLIKTEYKPRPDKPVHRAIELKVIHKISVYSTLAYILQMTNRWRH